MFVRGWKLFSCCAALLFLNAAMISLRAADLETRAFTLAQKLFDDGFYELAEKSFADFVSKYPASPRVAQAVLVEARAALAQKKFPTAIALLTTNLSNAAGLADQYRMAIARSYFTNGNFEAAAQSYSQLIATHTNSSLRLNATLEEAVTRMKLKQWARVISLLQNPVGIFQQTAARAPNSEAVVDGRLLLAEALVEQRRFAEAEQVTSVISDATVTTQSKWRRDQLRARTQFAGQKFDAALNTASNLVTIAAAARQPALEAAAVALEGEILEALDEPAAAIAAYEQNQRPGMPPERTREALFRIVELMASQGQLTNALARLDNFVTEHPNEANSDVAHVALAELRLKQFQFTATNNAATNLLLAALLDCEKIPTNSPFAGEAQFVRAWALFAQNRIAESLVAFRAAAEALPWSESQSVARFKAADIEFQFNDFTNALRDYRRVLGDYQSISRVQSELVPRARYQMLQAAIAARDLTSAEEVLEAIVREYPVNGYAERSLLLFGQAVDELGDPTSARKVFSKSLAQFPNSPLRPQIELAIARTFERERDWPNAIAHYDAWVKTFRTNEDLPSAEYRRAMANFHAGHDTNALMLFTNFIARFPTNALAERAQEWIGDFYFLRKEYEAAERNYQLVYQDRSMTAVGWQAKLKAGRAALLRPSFENATLYFTNIIDSAHCPTSIVVQAYFAYGEAYLARPTTNALDNFRKALTIYSQVTQFFPDDLFVPRAWGQMAVCHFQLGTDDPVHYAAALELYQKVTNDLRSDLPTRQQAQVGIGHVLRRQSELARDAGKPADAAVLLDAALANYLNVVYFERDGEAPDPFWLREAAMSAADISESRKNWSTAFNIYRRLQEKVPALRGSEMLNRRIATAQEQSIKQ